MIALDQALDVWADVDLSVLRKKSLDLADYFVNLIDRKCAGHDLTLITPSGNSADHKCHSLTPTAVMR